MIGVYDMARRKTVVTTGTHRAEFTRPDRAIRHIEQLIYDHRAVDVMVNGRPVKLDDLKTKTNKEILNG